MRASTHTLARSKVFWRNSPATDPTSSATTIGRGRQRVWVTPCAVLRRRCARSAFICPSSFDQPYWGRLIYSLGLGPKPLSLKKLKAKEFSKSLIDLVENESYRSAAAKIGKRIANENGVSRAVELIESFSLKDKV